MNLISRFRWDTFNDDNYDLDKASDIMTRYPLDIEITDDYDSTLDHYISLFVVAIAAIILALLACTAYGRFITAKTRHDRVPSSEETKSLLWAINYAKQSITFVSLLSLPILSVQKGREFFKVNPSFRMKRSRHVIRILKQKVLIAKLKKKRNSWLSVFESGIDLTTQL